MSESLNPFAVDASKVPLPKDHPHVARSYDREGSIQKTLDEHPRLKGVFQKSSRARTTLGENEGRWPQEAYDELIRQHPWTTHYTVHKQMTASSQEGYAVGFFQLTPREIPTAIAGPSTISVVTLPIVIKDFELYPFDVFAYKGSFYPMSEARITRILRMRDIFTESDRADFRDMLHNQDSSLTSRDLDTTSAYNRLPSMKFSKDLRKTSDLVEMTAYLAAQQFPKEAADKISATMQRVVGSPSVRERLSFPKTSEWHSLRKYVGAQQKISAQADAPNYRLKDAESSCGGCSHFDEGSCTKFDFMAEPSYVCDDWSASVSPKESLLKKMSEAVAVEVESTGESIRARPIWGSSPENGYASVGEWREVPSYKISSSFGVRALEQALDQGWYLRNYNSPTDRERNVLRSLVQDERMKVSRALIEKTSRPYASPIGGMGEKRSTPATMFEFINPRKLYGLDERFSGWIVNRVNCKDLDVAYPQCSDRLGVILEDGSFVYTPHEMDGLVTVSTSIKANIPKITKWLDGSTGNRTLATNIALWEQDGYLLGTAFSDESYSVDGIELFFSSEWDSSSGVHLNSGFKRMVREEMGDLAVLHVPNDAWVHRKSVQVSEGRDLSPAGSITIEPSSSTDTEESSEVSETEEVYAKESGKVLEKVFVEYNKKGGFKVSAAVLEKFPLERERCSHREAHLALAVCGASELMAEGMLKVAEVEGSFEGTLLRPAYGVSASLLEEATAIADKRSAQIEKTAAMVDPETFLHVAKELARTKTSGGTMDTSVDAALCLGFLNKSNLLKFVDLLPQLEESLSSLCALLMASRLGLDEIPEEACEGAVNAMEPILNGLRVIEYSLVV